MIGSAMDLHKKVKYPLFTTLMLCFSLLALLPMGVSNWLNYQQAKQLLIDSAEQMLIKNSNATSEYVNTWFDYRLMDLIQRSKTLDTIQLVSSLNQQFYQSGLPLNEYVGSPEWLTLVAEQQLYLSQLSQHYDYIYDILLIDVEGNVVFTVASENDLGTNILTGFFSETEFSKTVALTLESGKEQFSDIEYYPPSNNHTSAFMVAPLINKQGHNVGVIAVQLRLQRIFDRLLESDIYTPSLTHYFVGQDNLLRSPIRDNLQTILREKVDSVLLQHWLMHDDSPANLQVFEYKGLRGEDVFGLYQQIQIANVKWALLTEIDKSDVFVPIKEMAIRLCVIIFILSLIIFSLAIMQTKLILSPIKKLVEATIKVVHGDTNQTVEIKSNTEIGRLADVFKIMLSKYLASDSALQASHHNLRNTLLKLSSLQYTLDQHAIVAMTDAEGLIEFVNDKFCYISGYSSDKLIGQNHRIVNSGLHDDIFFKNLYTSIYSGKVWSGQICNRKQNGELYWVQTTIAPFQDKQHRIKNFIAIYTDITAQKEYEKKQQIELSISNIKFNIAKELASSKPLKMRLQYALELLCDLPDYNLLKKGGVFILEGVDTRLQLSFAIGDFGAYKQDVIEEMKARCVTQIKKPHFIQHKDSLLIMSHDHSQSHGHYILPMLSRQSVEDEMGLEGVIYLLTQCGSKISKEKQLLLEDIMDLFAAAIMREKASKLLKRADDALY